MPIQLKDLGKYKRPGIFIEEIDQSAIVPPIQTSLNNLVVGFSKVGPINNPILISDPTTFTNIFGNIDRSLENNGSYFHRTCLQMIGSGPVYCINLISLDDSRDKIQWASVSCASQYDNFAETLIPYSQIFNKQDFWINDPEVFQDYLQSLTSDWSDNRLLQLTNVGNQVITVFMFKSPITGFDITALQWYGATINVPFYLSPTDWMSDYIVTVLVLQGDWTNYGDLSVSTTYSKYFDSNGLIKSNINSFVNEPSVNTSILANYDVSLIPYFVDSEGRDMYIKNIINGDTNTTGLFCAYNEDLIDSSNFRLPMLDIIGYGLVNNQATTIDFMSYQQSIVKDVNFTQQLLDSSANVFGNYNYNMVTAYNSYISRSTASNSDYYVNAMSTGNTSTGMYYIVGVTGQTGNIIDTFITSASAATAGQQVYFNASFGSVVAGTLYTVYDSPPLYSIPLQTAENLKLAPQSNITFRIQDDLGNIITGFTYTPNLVAVQSNMSFNAASTSYYNLGGVQQIISTATTSFIFNFNNFSASLINQLVLQSTPINRTDVLYFSKGSSNVQMIDSGSFIDSTSTLVLGAMNHSIIYNNNNSAFTYTTNYLPVGIGADLSSGSEYGYVVLDSASLTITPGTSTLQFTFLSGQSVYQNSRNQKILNELSENLLSGSEGKMVLINLVDGTKYIIGTNYSIVGDVITITGLNTPANYYNGQAFIFYYVDDEFVIEDGWTTNVLLTTTQPLESLSSSGQSGFAAGVIGKYSLLYQDFYDGQINNGDYFYMNNNTGLTRTYLNMFMNTSSNLTVDFSQTVSSWYTLYNSGITVVSETGNFKETVELQNTTMYPDLTNVRQIWVDATRYSDVTTGMFLAAYYDPSQLAVGQAAKTLVRIIKSVNDPNNINNKILTADGPIQVIIDDGDYQTTAYNEVDEYVTDYVGIKILPFTMNAASIPDGTDAKLNTILEVIDKSTNLAQALANKNKIQWRYLIDSFGLGLNVSVYPLEGSKQQLADLCGMKKNCFGFINMPSLKSFRTSANPTFTNPDGSVNTAYIMVGGNQQNNPAYLYQFAQPSSDDLGNRINGPACTGYFFPYVQILDGNVPRWVPPAMFCASAYMRKFSLGLQPWTIIAGPDAGYVNGFGSLEIDFNNTDLQNLYQMGANPLVVTSSGVYFINSEDTSQIVPYSSLSLIHCREVLIELENSIYDMLLSYQWKFNTADIRAEIKYKADQICADLLNAGALYDYRNVCDATNNTNYIIDLQMGVLDTYIEIVKGMGIIVNNITILKTGSLQSAGF